MHSTAVFINVQLIQPGLDEQLTWFEIGPAEERK
jgi:hypothetical protein